MSSQESIQDTSQNVQVPDESHEYARLYKQSGVFIDQDPVLEPVELKPFNVLSINEIYRRRLGITRLTTPSAFKDEYKKIANDLSQSLQDAPIPLSSNMDEIMVDTPHNVIEKAMNREIAQYSLAYHRSLDQAATNFDISTFPQFGATMPNIADLEAPLEVLKRERFLNLLSSSYPHLRNAITGRDITLLANSYMSRGPPIPLEQDQVIIKIRIHDAISHELSYEGYFLDSQPLYTVRDAFGSGCLFDHANLIDPKTQFPRRVVSTQISNQHDDHVNAKYKDISISSSSSSSSLASASLPSSLTVTTQQLPPPEFTHLLTDIHLQRLGHYNGYIYTLPTPSSMFKIHDICYDDTRSPLCHRLSDPILVHSTTDARYTHDGIGFLHQRDQNVLLRDIPFRLGEQYLFLHQGCCQHIMMFTEMRIKATYDIDDVRCYPIPLYRAPLAPRQVYKISRTKSHHTKMTPARRKQNNKPLNDGLDDDDNDDDDNNNDDNDGDGKSSDDSNDDDDDDNPNHDNIDDVDDDTSSLSKTIHNGHTTNSRSTAGSYDDTSNSAKSIIRSGTNELTSRSLHNPYRNQGHHGICLGCGEIANIIVHNNRILPVSPTLLCIECHTVLNTVPCTEISKFTTTKTLPSVYDDNDGSIVIHQPLSINTFNGMGMALTHSDFTIQRILPIMKPFVLPRQDMMITDGTQQQDVKTKTKTTSKTKMESKTTSKTQGKPNQQSNRRSNRQVMTDKRDEQDDNDTYDDDNDNSDGTSDEHDNGSNGDEEISSSD